MDWTTCPTWVVGTHRLRRSTAGTNHNARNDKPDERDHGIFNNVIEKHDNLCLIFFQELSEEIRQCHMLTVLSRDPVYITILIMLRML